MRTKWNHGFLATKDFRKDLLRKQDLGLSEQQPAPNDLGSRQSSQVGTLGFSNVGLNAQGSLKWKFWKHDVHSVTSLLKSHPWFWTYSKLSGSGFSPTFPLTGPLVSAEDSFHLPPLSPGHLLPGSRFTSHLFVWSTLSHQLIPSGLLLPQEQSSPSLGKNYVRPPCWAVSSCYWTLVLKPTFSEFLPCFWK